MLPAAIPLSYAAPALAAAGAYLNARWAVSYDLNLMGAMVSALARSKFRERRDRVNAFYTLEGHAKSSATADQTFFLYNGREWTYKETYEMVMRYGTWFKTRFNVKPKEIVAVDFVNSDNFVFLWLGLWSIGACPAFINYNLTGKPLGHCVKTSTARLLIVDDSVRANVTDEVRQELKGVNGGVEIVFFDSSVERVVRSTAGQRAPDSCRSGALNTSMAGLIYTSGTTGLPKAAIVSWNKFVFAGLFVSRLLGWTKNDRMYTCMPLYHSSASCLAFSSALQSGSSIAIGRKFSTKNFWKEARESNATMIQYVGETCRYLLSAPPELDPVTGENLDNKNNVRMAFGNGLRPDVWPKFKERFGIQTIAEFYAATEGTSASWNISNNSFSEGAIGRNGTIARTLLGSQLAVVELDWATEAPARDPATGLCTRVAPGSPGELLYKLDPKDISAKFQGYFNNQKASGTKILRSVFTKDDAWFRSGDVIRWDAEGRSFFSDRIGDTFRWKSENVSTNEVAEVLGNHPSISEANVYGVELPHHDGRAGCAAVLLSEYVTAAESSSPSSPPGTDLLNSIATHTQSQLPRYAVPLFLRFIVDPDSVQRTGTNKQQKHGLRNQGVDPALVTSASDEKGDLLYWLKGGTYVPFGEVEWKTIGAGKVKL
ncbi:MAG: hypothetical protein M4579_003344 [Chaenotheca gracillima]|nr:MAG: hypothetical protein M4579_003344 [Chaenotheca gracillima]